MPAQPDGVRTTMADQLTADDRAAMRAFLQRSEVRLSSVHRAATALLSGAGVLVLLPALIGVIAVVRLGHSAFVIDATRAIRCSEEIAATVTVLSMVAALVLMGIAIGRIRDIRRHQQKEQVPAAHRVHLSPGIYTVIVLLLLLSLIAPVRFPPLPPPPLLPLQLLLLLLLPLPQQ